ncbi:MAG: hypothetical protein HW401_492 [Parcubacteria group bacterium]|nr:hypothetical protein [Parcubacteria group bacterium]
MNIDYDECPLRVMWFNRAIHWSVNPLYPCKEDDPAAELYVVKSGRGKLYNPIIHLGNKKDGFLVEIVAEKQISLSRNPSGADFLYRQIIDEIKNIKNDDYRFECEAFEIINERISGGHKIILRFYRFKNL